MLCIKLFLCIFVVLNQKNQNKQWQRSKPPTPQPSKKVQRFHVLVFTRRPRHQTINDLKTTRRLTEDRGDKPLFLFREKYLTPESHKLSSWFVSGYS